MATGGQRACNFVQDIRQAVRQRKAAAARAIATHRHPGPLPTSRIPDNPRLAGVPAWSAPDRVVSLVASPRPSKMSCASRVSQNRLFIKGLPQQFYPPLGLSKFEWTFPAAETAFNRTTFVHRWYPSVLSELTMPFVARPNMGAVAISSCDANVIGHATDSASNPAAMGMDGKLSACSHF